MVLDGSEGDHAAAGAAVKVKKTTAKLTQIDKQSDSGRRLVEYFVVVSSIQRDVGFLNKDGTPGSADADDPNVSFSEWKTESYDDEDEELSHYRFRPMITARYPLTDHSDNPLHENVTFFCHPSGGIHLRTEEIMPKVRIKKNIFSILHSPFSTQTHVHARCL
jgi:hypothetical protein